MMESGLTIRDYTPDDFPGLMALWEETSLSNKARGDNEETIRTTLQSGGRLILLLDNSLIIGSSWITNDGRRLYLHHFGILPGYQGRRLAHLLIRESLAFADQKKMQIKLEVHRSNTKAVSLYKKYGFGYLGDYDVYIIRR
ncbi:MAG: N-acetyltransferase [Bacteroidales bacterium]